MLKDVVSRQQTKKEELLKLQYIPRSHEAFGKKWVDTALIKVVLGPRRAGKSVFSLMLFSNRPFMYFDFDEEMLASEGGISTEELMKELHAVYGNVKNILFDEIQNLPAWELFANRLHREGYNLILTGSNAHLLSMELATHLTGRHIPIELLPFNFKEFLTAKKFETNFDFSHLSEKRGELLNFMDQYMTNGGFPEIVVNDLAPRDYSRVLFDSLMFKDVVKRHKVKFSTQISNLATFLINNFTSLYSLNRLTDMLGLKSVNTTDKYVNYLEEAYLIFSLSAYSQKATRRITSPKQVYIVDSGFMTAKAIQHSPDKGKLMENMVFMELVKKGYEPNRDLFYYKTTKGREVDFALQRGTEIVELLQVCYQSLDTDVEQRETKSLLEASQELSVKNLTILTWDEEREITKDGVTIQVRPLWKWLLENGNIHEENK